MLLSSWLRPLRWVLLTYTLLCLALWPLPLLGLLHVESSAVVAFAAYFAAGLSALAAFRHDASFARVLAAQEAALLLPLALLTVTLLWRPNCGYAQGLLFFALFPGITVGLAVAVAYALTSRHRRSRFPRTTLVLLGLGVALLGPLFDLGLHPQFYTYNHIFGGVLGPIYDEALVLRPGLFIFRGLTVLWALLAVLLGRRRRAPWSSGAPWLLSGVVLLIGLSYLFAGRLGITTPARTIERTLGSVHRTDHFDIYYDATAVSPDDLAWLAEDHEYRYARLAERLGTAPDARIASYLYPDAATKARLTGARTTNVAPVWLPRPQLHVLLDAYDRVFPHELVHVFSRDFGLPVLNASVSVGLVEGLAVALEPPDGRPPPDELVAVAMALRTGVGDDLARDLARRLSPLGFWTGRGAVSYTTMGSFVRYLLDAYGPDRLKAAYAWASFEAAYGKPVEALAREWQATLRTLPAVDRTAADVVRRRFTRPSLLEQRCPHYVPPHRRRYRTGMDALAAGDTTQALDDLRASLEHEPLFTPALSAWGDLMLAAGEADTVAARLGAVPDSLRTPSIALHLGDARSLQGRPDAARRQYAAARQQLPAYAHDSHLLLMLRRALASSPGTVRLLTSDRPPEVQARGLAAIDTSAAATWMRALRLAEAGQHEQAAAVLRTTRAAPDRAASLADRLRWERRRLVWRARLLHRAGEPAQAEALARRAAHAYLVGGDRNAAAALIDLATKMQWIQQRQSPRSDEP
ncbi:MAG: hypothetical protein GVY18_06135 [Bacteroidetes bacterium]|jgi:hypothetical protein|nr:hypothetical protein [Bacteroidota bacterium]